MTFEFGLKRKSEELSLAWLMKKFEVSNWR